LNWEERWDIAKKRAQGARKRPLAHFRAKISGPSDGSRKHPFTVSIRDHMRLKRWYAVPFWEQDEDE
jgi:hypothetical protein